MEWEEFTAHLVQLASSGVNSADDTSPRYQFSLDEDLVRHDYHCDYIKYHPDFGRFVVFERTSSRFKIYSSTNLLYLGALSGHRSIVLIETHGRYVHASAYASLHIDRRVGNACTCIQGQSPNFVLHSRAQTTGDFRGR
jgi:hypothetical protein